MTQFLTFSPVAQFEDSRQAPDFARAGHISQSTEKVLVQKMFKNNNISSVFDNVNLDFKGPMIYIYIYIYM